MMPNLLVNAHKVWKIHFLTLWLISPNMNRTENGFKKGKKWRSDFNRFIQKAVVQKIRFFAIYACGLCPLSQNRGYLYKRIERINQVALTKVRKDFVYKSDSAFCFLLHLPKRPLERFCWSVSRGEACFYKTTSTRACSAAIMSCWIVGASL